MMTPIEVTIYECAAGANTGGTPLATTSTIDGSYEFGPESPNADADVCLDPSKTYYVEFNLPDGSGEALGNWNFSTNESTCAATEDADDVDGTTGVSDCYNPNDDDDDDDVDVGIWECQEIGGDIFVDTNNNGCQDADESLMMTPIEVTIYECAAGSNTGGTPLATTSTIDGSYEFGPESPNADADVCLDPSKTYYVEFNLPDGSGEALENWNFSTNENTCAATDDADDVDGTTGVSDCYNPNDDDDDDDVDVGIWECQEIGGDIFVDTNNNGCQDADESLMMTPIEVTIYECAAGANTGGTPLATTSTIDGSYEFGPESPNADADVCLDPSKTYYVEFNLPDGSGEALENWNFSTNESTCAATEDADDVDGTTGVSDCYNPNDDDDDDDVDVGIWECQEIGGDIFVDTNNNGCQDADESLMMTPIEVTIYECAAGSNTGGTPLATTSTIDGSYEFGPESPNVDADVCLDPSKTYYVEFNLPDGSGEALENWNFSTNESTCAATEDADDVDGTTGVSDCYNPNDDDDDDDVDVGIWECQEIGGDIFVDTNNNGCQDADESLMMTPIEVTIYECAAGANTGGTPLATTSTIDGSYEFGPESPNVDADVCLDPSKTYYVEFNLPDGSGEALENWNFSTNESTCTATEDADDVDGTTGVSDCYNPLDDDDDEDIDVGIWECQELGGEVFDDENNNGCHDDDEVLVLEAVTVSLYECGDTGNSNGTLVTSTTTIDGAYNFGPNSSNQNADVCLDPSKTYYLEFTIPNGEDEALEGWEFTQGAGTSCSTFDTTDDVDEITGTTGCYDPLNPEMGGEPGDGDEHIDVGIINRGAVCGRIWTDCNGDGIRNDGAAGMANVQVDVYKEDGTYVGSVATDASGFYILEDLIVGNYYVKVNKPDGFSATDFRQGFVLSQDSDLDDSNGDSTTPSSYVGPGDCDPGSFDAGLYECIPIGELVWFDINENDVHDSFENGINGLPIELWQEKNGVWSLYETQLSGHKPGTPSDDGYFKFCAPPGTYEIRIDLPSTGLVPTVKNVGANGSLSLTDSNESATDSDVNFNQTTGAFTVDCNTGDVCNIGAGYYPMAMVGNRVWYDANNDGLQSAAESGVAGVQVKAYNSDDEMVSEAVTDSNGEYMVEYLGKDDYYLKFTPPFGYGMTTPHVGGNDTMDSDVDGSHGPGTTNIISLNSGDEIPTIDAGLVFGVVPVEWLSFTGVNRGNFNELDWSTASEINSSHFEIERSLHNTVDFVEIGKVVAAGNSSEVSTYEMRDYDVEEKGVYYYRLKQVDYNGNYSYSNTISIRLEGGGKDAIEMYPNPAVDEFTIDVSVSTKSEVAVSIWDATGKLIRNNVMNEVLEAGKYQRVIDVTELPAGMYNVKVTIENTVHNKKLMIVD